MIRIVCVGDFHYPDRSNLNFEEIESIKKLKPDIILVTGDLTSENLYNFLAKNFENIYVVEGNCDYLSFDKSKLIIVKGLKVLLTHGDIFPRGDIEAMLNFMKKNKIDILVVGHTHLPLFYVKDEKIIINPGSFTGSYSGGNYRVCYRSFCIIDIDDDKNICVRFFLKKKE